MRKQKRENLVPFFLEELVEQIGTVFRRRQRRTKTKGSVFFPFLSLAPFSTKLSVLSIYRERKGLGICNRERERESCSLYIRQIVYREARERIEMFDYKQTDK